MADIKLKAGTPVTITSTGPSTSNGAAGDAGANLDNSSVLAPMYNFELQAAFGSSVTALEDIDLYLVPILDGTNAAASDASAPNFQPSHFAGTFITPTTGTASRRLTIENVPLGPHIYRPYVVNKSGQTLSVNWTLKAFPYIWQSV